MAMDLHVCDNWYDGFRRRRRSKHVHNQAMYGIWFGMVARCTDPESPAWKDYGGRGIRVCERWAVDYRAFVSDVGVRPDCRYTLDRVNNDGNYEPGNVRWATFKEQAANKRESTCSVCGEVGHNRRRHA